MRLKLIQGVVCNFQLQYPTVKSVLCFNTQSSIFIVLTFKAPAVVIKMHSHIITLYETKGFLILHYTFWVFFLPRVFIWKLKVCFKICILFRPSYSFYGLYMLYWDGFAVAVVVFKSPWGAEENWYKRGSQKKKNE